MENKKQKTPDAPAPAWIRTLQAARFPFVLLVFLSHCSEALNLPPFNFGGECGVSLFFVLSGFSLSLGYGERVAAGTFQAKKFMLRRLSKLYPLHLLLFAAALSLDTLSGVRWSTAQLAANLLLVQTWLPMGNFTFVANGVSWFLCDMVFFYLVFGWLQRRLSAARWRNVVVLSALYLTAYLLLSRHLPESRVNCTLYVNPLLRLPDFAAGILLCRLYKGGAAERARRVSLGGLLPAFLIAAAFVSYSFLPPYARCQMLLLPFSLLAVLSLAAADGENNPPARLLHTPLMGKLGEVSFEFFMCHTLVLRLTRAVIPPGGTFLSGLSYAAASLLLSVAAALLLHRWFVRPVSQKMERLLG